jgi:hypothetical protein
MIVVKRIDKEKKRKEEKEEAESLAAHKLLPPSKCRKKLKKINLNMQRVSSQLTIILRIALPYCMAHADIIHHDIRWTVRELLVSLLIRSFG